MHHQPKLYPVYTFLNRGNLWILPSLVGWQAIFVFRLKHCLMFTMFIGHTFLLTVKVQESWIRNQNNEQMMNKKALRNRSALHELQLSEEMSHSLSHVTHNLGNCSNDWLFPKRYSCIFIVSVVGWINTESKLRNSDIYRCTYCIIPEMRALNTSTTVI